MSFIIEKQWKEFNISLPKLLEHLKGISDKFDGLAAHDCLWIVFKEKPSDEEIEQVNALYDSIDSEHEIAKSYISQEELKNKEEQIKEVTKNIKLGTLNKTWDQMSLIEKKIVMGIELTEEEKNEILNMGN